MPRGFLVKRSKKACMVTYRSRSSDDEQDNILLERVPLTFSQQHSPSKPFHSPDSGYGQSPITVPTAEYGAFAFEADSARNVPSPTLSSRSLPSPVSSSHSPVPNVPNLMLSSVSAPPTPKQQAATSLQSLKRPLTDSAIKSSQKVKKSKYKAARKLNFNEQNSSPVNGTIIMPDEDMHNAEKDTKETKISNPGDIVCQLCKGSFNDPLSLAQHKCSRIVHVEYRCPECDKVFNCPANLASHRRWHKPRPQTVPRPGNSSPRILPAGLKTNSKLLQLDSAIGMRKTTSPLSDTTSLSDRSTPSPRSSAEGNDERTYDCELCGKKFRRQGYLRKHMQQHGESDNHPCQYCGRLFDSLTSREKHLLTHLSPPMEVACNICGGVFLDKLTLQQHLKMHETREVYHCKYCISSFQTPNGLTHHLNKCHSVDNRNVLLLHVPRMGQEIERSMIST